MSEPRLRRELGFMSMVAIGAGAVIGGWLAEAPYWFSVTGAGAAFIFPLLAILLIPVALAFAELTSILPYSCAVDVWTCHALGYNVGWATQWLFYLIQVVEPPLMAFIFITAINFFIPIPQNMVKIVAITFVFLWYIVSNFRIGLTGILATIFFWCMVVMSLIVACTFFASSHWSLENINAHGGWFPKGSYGIMIAFAVFVLKFIGFEMVPTLAEEIKFNPKDMVKVILSALLVPAILYLIVVLAMGGMAPWDKIANMSMPEPEIVRHYGLPAIIGVTAIIAGLLHALTTLMGFWTSSARALYGAAELNQLPKIFMKLNRHGQPVICNVVVLFFSIFFCMFTGTNWVQYIYAVSCIAAGLVYGIVCIDAIILRKKYPNWERPYMAPGGNIVFVIGIIVSIWVLIGSCFELDLGGYISLGIYFLIGLLLHGIMNILRKKDPIRYAPIIFTPNDVRKNNNV